MADKEKIAYSALTTFSPKGYEMYGRRMLETFDRYWPMDITLYVYWEEVEPDYKSSRIVYRNLFESSPDLVRFIERNKDNPLDGSSRVVRMTEGGEPVYDISRAGIRFAYKSYAIYHANMHADTDYLIWLDADTVTLKPMPINLLDELCPKDTLVSYFGRKNMYTETGWIAFNTRHGHHAEFIAEIKRGYDEDLVYTYSQAHDCVNFDIARKKTEKDFNARSFDISQAYYIDSTHPIINSPLGAYLDHLKGTERKVRGRSFNIDYNATQSFGRRVISFARKYLRF